MRSPEARPAEGVADVPITQLFSPKPTHCALGDVSSMTPSQSRPTRKPNSPTAVRLRDIFFWAVVPLPALLISATNQVANSPSPIGFCGNFAPIKNQPRGGYMSIWRMNADKPFVSA